MATSKTLAPTNVTINIPALADQPDASVFSNCIDKEADAINDLTTRGYDSKSGQSLIDIVKAFKEGTYNFRLDTATEAPTSGGIVYKVVKTHGANDTRCVITAMPMAANSPVYTAFVGQSATTISWSQLALNSQIASVPYIKHYNGTSLTVALPKYSSGLCTALVAGIGSCTFSIYRSANYIVKTHLSGEENATNAIAGAIVDDTTVTLSASGARIEITTILSNLL